MANKQLPADLLKLIETLETDEIYIIDFSDIYDVVSQKVKNPEAVSLGIKSLVINYFHDSILHNLETLPETIKIIKIGHLCNSVFEVLAIFINHLPKSTKYLILEERVYHNPENEEILKSILKNNSQVKIIENIDEEYQPRKGYIL